MTAQLTPERQLAELAAALRRLRRECGLTLEQAAARSGLSHPFISRLEAGQRQPSLAALLSLAGVYGVAVGELFGASSPSEGGVIDPAAAPEREGNGLRFRVIDRQDPASALSAIKVTVPAEREGRQLYEHAGEEWLYVLAGRLELTLGDAVHLLESGQAAHFDAQAPHRLDAVGERDAELLLVAARPAADVLASYLHRAG